MRRSRVPAPFIPGDDQENDRIQLEHNLRHSETAIHLSSATESEPESYEQESQDDDLESLEFPRHNSGPAPFGEFPSFDRRVRDYMADEDAPGHGWSYRTGDDYEEGINPYGGESLSTIHHHASAVTLSAGLGGRGARRDVSISGAEYDPDRPLNEIIAGVTSKLSILDTPSRSKRQTLDSMTVDPLVVEDTAELDQILETGAQPSMHSRLVRSASPITSGSSSHSDTDHTLKSRPKLSDALRSVALSPKRPRSPQIIRAKSPSLKAQATSSLSRGATRRPSISHHVATPRPPKQTTTLSSAAQPPNPAVVLHPPTPSSTSASTKSGGSKFTRMANGLAKEIEYEKGQLGKLSASTTKRPERTRSATAPTNNVFNDGSAPPPDHGNIPRSSVRDRSRIQLPDVTGITNAIESPAKGTAQYYAYRAEGRIRETENRLLHTLNTVQMKIQQLEEENGISRRRVRELEMELEDCKREVTRERTRLVQQEELLKREEAALRASAKSGYNNKKGKGKGKGRARDVGDGRDVGEDTLLFQERYKEAVEEKKALEALITSLRTHLARLTSELSSHRELLTELRTIRDIDSVTLKQKSEEITRLKVEVERLAGEVEVLRGVVEEGLRERRLAKEMSRDSEGGLGWRGFGEEDGEDDEDGTFEDDEETEEDEEEEDDMETETETESDGAGLSYAALDRTLRTDRATEGSSPPTNARDGRATRFMDSDEFERISAEIDERRSNRSFGSVGEFGEFGGRDSPSPRSRRTRTRRYYDDDEGEEEIDGRPVEPEPVTDLHHLEAEEEDEEDVYTTTRTRPSSRRQRRRHAEMEHEAVENENDENEEGAFPKIRGKRLERLFFAAPEHDARTCATCNRRRREEDELSVSRAWRNRNRRGSGGSGGGGRVRRASGSGSAEDVDEGFAEGFDNLDYQHAQHQHQHHRQRQQQQGRNQRANRQADGEVHMQRRERSLQDIGEVRSVAHQEGLPPQTIVARIIRELEDDFTHYKSIYIELADQYKEMDAASNVAKRNTLAKHLREVVDVLEQKGDQIAALYDQLSFRDKPSSTSSGQSSKVRTR